MADGAAAFVLAAWKGGELLRGLEKAGGMGGDLKSSGHVDRTISQYARTLDAAKLSESTAKRWQRIARHWSLEAVGRSLSERFQHDKLPAQTKKPDRGLRNWKNTRLPGNTPWGVTAEQGTERSRLSLSGRCTGKCSTP